MKRHELDPSGSRAAINAEGGCDVLRLTSNLCSSHVHPNSYTKRGDWMTWLLFVHAVEQRLP
jgi:hypothetical protein